MTLQPQRFTDETDILLVGDCVRTIELFVDDFFEITDSPNDCITQKEFRHHFLVGINTINAFGTKPYEGITYDAVKDYLQERYGFKWIQTKINGMTAKMVVSNRYSIKSCGTIGF